MHEIAAWIALVFTFAGGIYYLSRQLDGKLTANEYNERHRELEERIRRLEFWAAKKSYGGDIDVEKGR